MFVQLLVSGLAMGGIFATIALGFTLLWNTGGVVNFAYGEFAMISMYFAYTFLVLWKWPLWAAVLGAVLATTLLAAILERLAIRPNYAKDPLTIIIVTIGAQIILSNVAQFVWGTTPLQFPPLFGNQFVTRYRIAVENLWIFATVAALIAVFTYFFQRTDIGIAMRSIAQDREAAALMGVPVSLMLTLAFAISAGLGAVSGVLLAPLIFVSADIGMLLVMKAFIAAVVGGFGSYVGALVGGLLIGVVDNLSASYISSDYRDVITFSVLIAVLLVRPAGLFGLKAEVR